MANNSTVTKLLQISEEKAPAVQIPIIVGNEVFVLTQQDIRRIEDIRLLSYNRLTSNGQLYPIPNQWNAHTLPNQFPCFVPQVQPPATQNCPNVDNDMEKNPLPVVADVAKQVSWSKQTNSSSPYPMRYSVATSTSGLQKKASDHDRRQASVGKMNIGCQTCTTATSRASNTEPRRPTTSQASNTEPERQTTSQASNTEPMPQYPADPILQINTLAGNTSSTKTRSRKKNEDSDGSEECFCAQCRAKQEQLARKQVSKEEQQSSHIKFDHIKFDHKK